MARVAKILYMAYNSLVLALLFACASFRIVWLEMRVNIGLLLFAYIIVAFILFCIVLRKKKGFRSKYKLFTVINLAASSLLALIMLGAKSIAVVPAAFIREGLHATHLSFTHVNATLCTILAVGLVIILVQRVRK